MKREKSICVTCCFFLFAMLVLGSIPVLGTPTGHQNRDAKMVFESKYKAWQEHCKQPEIGLSSSIKPYIDNDPYREMVQLGIPVLPYMIEKIENDPYGGGRFLCALAPPNMAVALPTITKKKFHIRKTEQPPSEFRWTVEEFPDMRDMSIPPVRYKLWLRWWKEGHKQTPQCFENLYKEWQELKKQKKDKDAKAKYQQMLDLGIAALPYMTEKVEQGDTELIPAISVLTDGKVKKDTKQSECLDWWKKNREKWLIPFPETKIENDQKSIENSQ